MDCWMLFSVPCRGTLSKSEALVFEWGSMASSSIHSSLGGEGGSELLSARLPLTVASSCCLCSLPLWPSSCNCLSRRRLLACTSERWCSPARWMKTRERAAAPVIPNTCQSCLPVGAGAFFSCGLFVSSRVSCALKLRISTSVNSFPFFDVGFACC